MRRVLAFAAMGVLALLIAGCTESQPEERSTTIAATVVTTTTPVNDVPTFESWQEWADWRMYEMGVFQDPFLYCSANAGWDFTTREEVQAAFGEDDFDADLWKEISDCHRRTERPLISCLEGKAWKIVVDEFGNWHAEVGPDRMTEYQNSFDECQRDAIASLGHPGFAAGELPYYFAALDDVYACITGLGHEIAPPPPFDEWAATVNDPDVVTWDPLRLLPQVRYMSVVAVCPEPLR